MTAMRWVFGHVRILLRLVRCSGLAVDRVCRFAVFEDVDDGVRGGQAGAGPGLDGLAGEVGGDEHVVAAA